MLKTNEGYSSSTIAVGKYPESICVTDLNNDGNKDLAVLNKVSTSITILLGTGIGTFTLKTTASVGYSPSCITSADYNGDGFQDLATVNGGDNDLIVLLGDGQGYFPNDKEFSVDYSPFGIVSSDLNDDDLIDLIVTNTSTNNLSVLYNTTAKIVPLSSISVCWGDSVKLVAKGGTIRNNWISDTIVATSTGKYTLTTSNLTSSCSSSNSIQVKVNPLPVVSLQTFSPVCHNASPFNLTGGYPEGGLYTGSGVLDGIFNPDEGTQTITYKYTDANGCIDSTSKVLIVDVCTEITDNTLDQVLSVYPNPAKDFFIINYPGKVIDEIIITNQHGCEVLREQVSDESYYLPTKALLPGIYLLQIKNKNELNSVKLLVE